MMLEDFSTPTEQKNGLTSPCRVRELIAVLQEERDCFMKKKNKKKNKKNVDAASRERSAVASIISATKNKDCLDLFIELNGLWFINEWLKDDDDDDDDPSPGFSEDDSIVVLLCALEKLQVEPERLISSGIHATVSHLVSHCNPLVRDKASSIADAWKRPAQNLSANIASNMTVEAICASSGSRAFSPRDCEGDDSELESAVQDEHGGELGDGSNGANKIKDDDETWQGEGEFEFGMVDALEVARQVAREVELEVVDDCREPSCSSCEKITSIGDEHQPIANNPSAEAIADSSFLSSGHGRRQSSNTEPETSINDASGEDEAAMAKGAPRAFDLNQQAFSDDMDSSISSMPNLVAGAGGRRTSPLLHRGIDLNVADVEEEDEEADVDDHGSMTDSSARRPIPLSSDKLFLDLNHASVNDEDDDDAPSSSASSSSSRNFDLNDDPIFHSCSSDSVIYNELGTVTGACPTISIMGTRVQVGKQMQPPPPPPPPPQPAEAEAKVAMEEASTNFGIMGGFLRIIPSTAPIFAYGGGVAAAAATNMYPSSSSSSFQDSVAGLMPQPFSHFSEPPPFMVSSQGVVPLAAGNGLQFERENPAGPLGFQQFLGPCSAVSNCHLWRSSLQATLSCGPNGKRKEPEGGWDLFSVPPLRRPQTQWR